FVSRGLARRKTTLAYRCRSAKMSQCLYAQSTEPSDYFPARQWYDTAGFGNANPRETRAGVALTKLVHRDAKLLGLWKQLSGPFDAFLGHVEDGTIREYADTARAVLGTSNPISTLTDAQVAEIQKKLDARLPSPQVSDQLLSPEQYLRFPKETKGFRLLPPRRLPDAI